MNLAIRLALALLLAVPTGSCIASPVQIGNKTVVVPTPPGFGRVAPEMKDLLDLLDTFTPPSNKSLALYLSESDLALAMSGDMPDMERRYVVQIPKMAIDHNFTAVQFEALKTKSRTDLEKTMADIRPRVNGLMDKASGTLSEKIGTDVELGMDSVVPFPVHHETQNSLSMSVLSRYSVAIKDGEKVSEVASSTMSFVRVKNTVFMLLVYGGRDDLEWTREQSKRWVRAVTAANSEG